MLLEPVLIGFSGPLPTISLSCYMNADTKVMIDTTIVQQSFTQRYLSHFSSQLS